MRHLREALRRRRAYSLSRRIGRYKLWMLRFDGTQFAHQLVVLRVADFRVVQHIVAVVVVVEGVAEFCNLLENAVRDVGGCHKFTKRTQ